MKITLTNVFYPNSDINKDKSKRWNYKHTTQYNTKEKRKEKIQRNATINFSLLEPRQWCKTQIIKNNYLSLQEIFTKITYITSQPNTTERFANLVGPTTFSTWLFLLVVFNVVGRQQEHLGQDCKLLPSVDR